MDRNVDVAIGVLFGRVGSDFFFFQAEDGIRDADVTGVQTCALPIFNLHRVELQVYDFNPRGIRAYEKLGFVHEGRRREVVWREGAYHDMLLMSILEDEWRSEERRVGKECRAGWAAEDYKKSA